MTLRNLFIPIYYQWYLSNSKCVIDSANDLHDCMDVLKNEINDVRRNEEENDWLPTACCYFDKFKQCFEKGIQPHCDKEGKKFVHWARDAYLTDLTDIACPSMYVHGTSKCTSLIGKIPPKPVNSTESEPISVLGPVYKMFINFDFESRPVPNKPKP